MIILYGQQIKNSKLKQKNVDCLEGVIQLRHGLNAIQFTFCYVTGPIIYENSKWLFLLMQREEANGQRREIEGNKAYKDIDNQRQLR